MTSANVPESTARGDLAKEEMLQAISGSPLIVTRMSDKEVLFASPSVKALLGAAPSRVEGCAVPEFVTDSAGWQDFHGEVAQRGEVREWRFAVRAPRGQVRWVSLNGKRMEYEGQPACMVSVRDITELKHVEDKLSLLSAALEQSDDLTMITDRAGLIEYVNPSWCATTGYAADEVIGTSPALVKSGVHGSDFYESLWSTIVGGDVWRGRFTNRTKDGLLFQVEKTITPVRDATGAIAHFLSTAKDVTEQLRLEAQLGQAKKMEALGRLAGGIAHDFNNLLTVILGHVGLAQEGGPTGDDNKHLEEAMQAALRAAELTSQLLIFSRTCELDSTTLDVNEVIEDVHRMLSRVIGEGIRMVVDLEPMPLWVSANAGQLGQVLMNVAVNARDAMPYGGALRIVSSRVVMDESLALRHGVEPGHFAMIAVTDDGIGMTEDAQAKAFDPFFTTKEAYGGTGLGLATAYGIITQSGGDVWIDSQPHEGTIVTFVLPMPSDLPPSEEFEDLQEAEWLGGSGRILVVEDEALVRTLVVDVLERVGYEVLVSESGEDAVELCRIQAVVPDLLITDIVLTGMSGLDLAEKLLQDYPAMRQLHMSGYARGEESTSTGGMAATPRLEKPFIPTALLEAVRLALHPDGEE